MQLVNLGTTLVTGGLTALLGIAVHQLSALFTTGYAYCAVGENIAAGQTSVQSVMSTWINSPGHCQNLMNPTYRDMGVACVRNDAASYRLYWTMDLGRSR
ncbi:MAG: CAP domain-containing protein [Rhodoferax sp.]|nr:CAP domain-containing protein [Rhodoferax sp.]MDP3655044.1 CAP domain-containing protein [Rhodoferax sp.]